VSAIRCPTFTTVFKPLGLSLLMCADPYVGGLADPLHFPNPKPCPVACCVSQTLMLVGWLSPPREVPTWVQCLPPASRSSLVG
jgi:hypothetical protein